MANRTQARRRYRAAPGKVRTCECGLMVCVLGVEGIVCSGEASTAASNGRTERAARSQPNAWHQGRAQRVRCMPGLGAAVRLARDETECANAEDAADVRDVRDDDPADAPEVLPGGAAEENDTRTVGMAGGEGADEGPHEPAENDGADDQRGKGKTESILPGRNDGE